ncbi:hypothetical protein Tco_1044465 [Tanacetum coccineum]|uniref:Uncharacterized protein n=1 Tax=Tanacetum coccineum TaxID=301880 RepID=A0ABQ5GQQ0_9ASTR
MGFNLVNVEGVWQVWRVRLSLIGDSGGVMLSLVVTLRWKLMLQRVSEVEMLSGGCRQLVVGFFLQMGFTLILATLDGLDVGLLGDVIDEDDCDDDD